MADNPVYVDFEDGKKRVMNNAKLYVKLLAKFKDGTSLDELETAVAAGDLEKAQAQAHTIKGVAANLSLTELANQSLELENQIKSGSVNPDTMEHLKTVFSATLQEAEKVIAENG